MRTLILVASVLGFLCPAAWADLTPVGDPTDGGSWSQLWEESSFSAGPFDFVAIRIVGNAYRVTPATVTGLTSTPLTSPIWTVIRNDPQLVTMAGPDITGASALDFTLWFDDTNAAAAPTFSMDEAIFRDGVLLGTTHLTYKDSLLAGRNGATGSWQWKFYAAGANPYWNPTIAQVPIPGAALLGLLGFSLIGWVKRRFA